QLAERARKAADLSQEEQARTLICKIILNNKSSDRAYRLAAASHYNNLALCQIGIGKFAEARTMLAKAAAELNPPFSLGTQSSVNLAMSIDLEVGDRWRQARCYNDALAACTDAIKLSKEKNFTPDLELLARAYDIRASAYENAGKADLATNDALAK